MNGLRWSTNGDLASHSGICDFAAQTEIPSVNSSFSDNLHRMTTERIEVQRTIRADPASIFAALSDPQGHVAIDGSGMLMDADGDIVTAVGDEFVVHMDREAFGRPSDAPLHRTGV